MIWFIAAFTITGVYLIDAYKAGGLDAWSCVMLAAIAFIAGFQLGERKRGGR